ncbi:transmembrane protein, putative (macronuclear) [Tetrahymena thermophila SB210]|uniref:Transmembrane protein, putative n=1 Tax=Tetrahymena thermophila (strain SB210) TaxID=312017 RepID=W7XL91_TETTS|nr:transmembrane protein, putative [Tetrahymena thermophila SB210]EWS75879.1 transmembrane protein, putative [Tetrahymena thermophila SB210]|eukprot:XP_012651582.1 transmembrane protein, putative [Tetrahymena thermophila SB210]
MLNILIITFVITEFWKTSFCLEKFPIISDCAKYIEDQNAIFYNDKNSNTFKISILDINGQLSSTYTLNSFSYDCSKLSFFFTAEQQNIIYLTQYGAPDYYLIDFSLMQQNSPSFLTQKKYATFPFTSINLGFIVFKTYDIYYLVFAKETSKLVYSFIYLICESSFDKLFTSKNIIQAKQQMDFNYFFQKPIYFQKFGWLFIVSEKYSIYYQDDQRSILKLSVDTHEQKFIMKIDQITDTNKKIFVIEIKSKSIIAFYTNKMNFYSAEDLVYIDTFGDSISICYLHINYFQNNIFTDNNNYELQYDLQKNKIQVIHSTDTTPYYQLNWSSVGFTQYLSNYQTKNNEITNLQIIYNILPGCQNIDKATGYCSQCSPNYFLQNKWCVIQCNEGYYQSGNQCLPCDKTCLTCDGPSPKNCLKCPQFYYLVIKSKGSSCKPCHESCKTCNGPSVHDCLTCSTFNYLFQESSVSQCLPCDYSKQTCFGLSNKDFLQCPQGNYIILQENQYYQTCHPDCLECDGPSNSNCLKCKSQQYLDQQKCISCHQTCQSCNGPSSKDCLTCPSQKYLLSDNSCIDCNQIGQTFVEQKCISCDKTCLTCNGPSSSDCLSCPQQKYLQKSIDYNQSGQPISVQKCETCYQTCQSCNGPSSKDCLTCPSQKFLFLDNSCIECNKKGQKIISNKCNCIENYTFVDGECVQSHQNNLDYKSNVFSQQTIQQVRQKTQTASSVSLASTIVLSFIQNLFSSSSFGIFINGFACFKLSYLTLVNNTLPQQINSALEVFTDQCPNQTFKNINFLYSFITASSQDQYQNNSYYKFGISFNILETSGQGLSLFLICSFLFILFYLMLEKIQNRKVKSILLILYNKIFSCFIIQHLYLVIPIFVIGINQQMKQFIFKYEVNSIGLNSVGLQIVFLIIIILIIILLQHQQYLYLNRTTPVQKQLNFQEINRVKLQNDVTFESKIRRNFMIIYQTLESFLIPICFLQVGQNWMICNIITIIIQLSSLIIIIYLKPFYSKLTNGYFILDSALWLGLYIQFFILNIYSSKPDFISYAEYLDQVSVSFLVTIQLILFGLTIYMLTSIFLQIYYLIKKRKNSLQKQEESLINSKIISIQFFPQNLIYRRFTNSLVKFRVFNLKDQKNIAKLQKFFISDQNFELK